MIPMDQGIFVWQSGPQNSPIPSNSSSQGFFSTNPPQFVLAQEVKPTCFYPTFQRLYFQSLLFRMYGPTVIEPFPNAPAMEWGDTRQHSLPKVPSFHPELLASSRWRNTFGWRGSELPIPVAGIGSTMLKKQKGYHWTPFKGQEREKFCFTCKEGVTQHASERKWRLGRTLSF